MQCDPHTVDLVCVFRILPSHLFFRWPYSHVSDNTPYSPTIKSHPYTRPHLLSHPNLRLQVHTALTLPIFVFSSVCSHSHSHIRLRAYTHLHTHIRVRTHLHTCIRLNTLAASSINHLLLRVSFTLSLVFTHLSLFAHSLLC
jgi:hypothetical protein